MAAAFVLSVATLVLSGAVGHTQTVPPPGEFEPQQVIVKLDPSATDPLGGVACNNVDAVITLLNGLLQPTFPGLNLNQLESFAGRPDILLLGLQGLPAGSDLQGVVGQLQNLTPCVQFAEPNFIAEGA